MGTESGALSFVNRWISQPTSWTSLNTFMPTASMEGRARSGDLQSIFSSRTRHFSFSQKTGLQDPAAKPRAKEYPA